MIHTLTLTHEYITNNDFEILRKSLQMNYKRKEHKYYTNNYRDKGFTLELKKIRTQTYKNNVVLIKLNLSKLMKTNKVTLINNDDLPILEKAFNDTVKAISPILPKMFYWNVNRIDYSINIKTPYVTEYIRLFHRCNYKKEALKYIDGVNISDGSFYIASKTSTINFYDKEDELLKKKNYSEEDWEESKNVLRLEVECERSKVNATKKKFNLSSTYFNEFLNPQISYDTITYVYKKYIGCGDFYSLDKCKKLIDNTFTARNKERLKLLVQNIAKHKGITNYLVTLNDYEKKQAKKDVITLNKKNINPVTIPRDYKINTLPSLKSKILDNLY